MFNNSQLCSQAPSPQREPHHAAWTAAGLLLCVCSVTLISSMSMLLHLSRLQRRDLCCCINNKAWYCPGGSLLCVSGFCLFSPICYAVYPNMERGAFQAFHVADAVTHGDYFHLLQQKDALACRWRGKNALKVSLFTRFNMFYLCNFCIAQTFLHSALWTDDLI